MNFNKKRAIDAVRSAHPYFRHLSDDEICEIRKSHAARLQYLANHDITNYDEAMAKLRELKSLPRGITLAGLIARHGEVKGTEIFSNYRKRCAETNTFEFKNKTHGWSRDDFDEYNARRAMTLDNMCERYGDEEGTERWNAYCERQRFTNSAEFLGKDRYKAINKKKAITLENFQEKYGIATGLEKYIAARQSTPMFYSAASQEFCDMLMTTALFAADKVYYATHSDTGEYGCLGIDNVYYKYDFVSIDKRLCIEYNGDYFHANPKMYSPGDVFDFGRGEITARDIWDKDQVKLQSIRETRGFDVIVVWDSEFKQNKEKTIERIIKHCAE